MDRALIYTFYNPLHVTFKIVRALDSEFVDKYYLGNLGSLPKHILETKPKYILGLGDYRKGSKNIRIERVFVNKYGKKPICEGGKEEYLATWELEEQEGVSVSEKPTFGPCNRSAYYLLKCIEDNGLETKLAFIHVPSSYVVSDAVGVIQHWLP